MKAAELRQSILQAAVQGKLVPQNVHDEPASELLKLIHQERARLIKEGKIKKEKPLSPITEDETPYDLPDGWIWCKLGDVSSKIHYGYTSSATKNGFAKMLRITDIQNNTVLWDNVPFCDIEENRFNDYALNNNDILIARTGGTIGKTYMVSNICLKAVFASYLIRVVPILKYSVEYLKYFLECPFYWEQLRDKSMGTGQPNVNGQSLSNLILPLPPLAEQQRIVAKVDELMALCDELEAAEKELDILEKRFEDYLPKSILQAAMQGKLVPQNIHDEPASKLLTRIQHKKALLIKEGKIKKEKPLSPIVEDEIPYDLHDGWVWCRLSDIGEVVGGATPSSTEPTFYTITGDGIPWITPADMKYAKNNLIARGSKDITLIGFNSCSTRMLPAGSVVFSSRAPIGLLAFAENDLCTNQGFKSVIPHEMSMNKWIYYALMHLTENIIGRASGTTFLEVSGEFMRKELFPLPPLTEQQRIVAKVDELFALCNELKAAKVFTNKPTVSNAISFPQQDEHEELLMVAQGEVSGKLSKELRQAQEDLFGDGADE